MEDQMRREYVAQAAALEDVECVECGRLLDERGQCWSCDDTEPHRPTNPTRQELAADAEIKVLRVALMRLRHPLRVALGYVEAAHSDGDAISAYDAAPGNRTFQGELNSEQARIGAEAALLELDPAQIRPLLDVR